MKFLLSIFCTFLSFNVLAQSLTLKEATQLKAVELAREHGIGEAGANSLQKGEFDTMPRSGIMASAREEVSA